MELYLKSRNSYFCLLTQKRNKLLIRIHIKKEKEMNKRIFRLRHFSFFLLWTPCPMSFVHSGKFEVN